MLSEKVLLKGSIISLFHHQLFNPLTVKALGSPWGFSRLKALIDLRWNCFTHELVSNCPARVWFRMGLLLLPIFPHLPTTWA